MTELRCHTLTNAQKVYMNIKRILDPVLALIGILILSPVFIVICLAIKLEEGLSAPVFFTQKRVGINKSHFMLYKFRSMRVDTPAEVPTHLLTDPEQYITKVGSILRKTSLDELPQLLNILKGDIAICGPRPALWNQYDLMEERDKYGVHAVKPGLTGWAQVNGRDALEIDIKAQYDGYYVAHMGPVMDVRCFLKTIIVVLTFIGVIEGGTGAMEAELEKTEEKAV